MSDFRDQIREDIEDYVAIYPNIPRMSNAEWAFNFWVLDKLYSEDEAIIEERIVDINDRGIDCFVWHEEQLNLYLIQNKYYSDASRFDLDYIQNDFLSRAITALKNHSYNRSPELQRIYDRFSDVDGFTIQFVLYVTNNVCKTQRIKEAIDDFNANPTHPNYFATIYELDDIKTLYYGAPDTERRALSFDIQTVNRGTVLQINPAAYRLTLAVDAKYVMAPVFNLYQLYEKANKVGYPIFDQNIRDYLGTAGTVNKGIRATLKDERERNNFFYYNNGVTILVDEMTKTNPRAGYSVITIENPKIVNGCQTVSTIGETLDGWPQNTVEEDFKNTFVMLKLIKIPGNTSNMLELKNNIVTFNNSQNSINQKTFTANIDEFRRVQAEFRHWGFLLCIKQSDKYQFTKVEFRVPTALLDLSTELRDRFGLQNMTSTKDFLIDIEKLLQVIIAFISTSQNAVQNKSKLLKVGTQQNKDVIDFIKNDDVTMKDILYLYLLFLRATQEKNAGRDGKTPIPLYVINCFARYNCNGNLSKISENLADKEMIDSIIRLNKMALSGYYSSWTGNHTGKDYNDMIKSLIDWSIMDNARNMAESMILSGA